ncbi:MAG TPA: hypothetical protein VH478_01195 [Trebonia sp.]|nr:hypothetical protein [Trebonia sp.]
MTTPFGHEETVARAEHPEPTNGTPPATGTAPTDGTAPAGDPGTANGTVPYGAAPANGAAATPPQTTQRQIGIWGATSAGKSTFLSSIFFATTRSTDHLMVWGNNDASTDFLVNNTETMTNRMFPPPTVDRAHLSWTIQMQVRNRRRGLFRRGPEQVPFRFDLEIQDAGGLDFLASPQAGVVLDIGQDGAGENIAAYLSRCTGLLMLLDPIREKERGDAYQFFFGPLLRMAQLRQLPEGERLPHHVAICVTKFDDPRVFEYARDRGLLSYSPSDPLFLPRVHENDSERFMRAIFQELKSSDIDLVLGGLRQYFYEDRIKFFVSSSVGFFIGPSGQFRDDDYKNVAVTNDNKTRIRGAIRPINVAEPLVWLGERLAEQGQR